MVGGWRSAVGGRRSAVSGRRSAVGNQQKVKSAELVDKLFISKCCLHKIGLAVCMYVYLNFKSENRSYPEVHSPTKIQAHIIGSFYKLQHPSIVSVSVGVSRHEQYLR